MILLLVAVFQQELEGRYARETDTGSKKVGGSNALYVIQNISLDSLCMLAMYINNFLHFIIAAHEYARSIMNMIRHNCQHALHATINGLATS